MWVFIFVSRHSSLFIGSCLHLWVVVPLVWCGGGPSVVGVGGSSWPFALLCCCAVLSCSWCETGMVKGRSWCTHLNNLDSDNSMHHHRLEDMAHLPCCLHHLSSDVALPCCCYCCLCAVLYHPPHNPHGLHWIPLDSTGLHWIPLDSTGLHWTPLDFTI